MIFLNGKLFDLFEKIYPLENIGETLLQDRQMQCLRKMLRKNLRKAFQPRNSGGGRI